MPALLSINPISIDIEGVYHSRNLQLHSYSKLLINEIKINKEFFINFNIVSNKKVTKVERKIQLDVKKLK